MTGHVTLASASAEETRRFGEILGRALLPGDVVVLDGELGAGKTTFTQGIAAGLGVLDQVTSPTFVLAREMSAGAAGTPLLHVDAYRIGSLHEWDDLDLDLASFATVVEWGQQVAEALPIDRLEVRMTRQDTAPHTEQDDFRALSFTAHGPRSRRLLAVLDGEL